ncbi:PfkB family carbohydrate kinase [Peptoniphilus sp.]|jgi:fructose-1-phosphate kinase PfkB-like protein|uniref:PfkB family carbohydrate kinase n=1 Tax=Peptoniphilus sp. TaxID=1971214 RepID=UPI003D8B6A2D
MILFCDFNPKVVRKYIISEEDNVIDKTEIYPSGLGVEMATFVKNIGSDTEVLLLKGTEIGDELIEKLKSLGVMTSSVKLKDDNVEEIIIKKQDKSESYRTKSPRITMEDKNELFAKFEDAVINKNIVVIPKIDHASLDSSIYEKMVKFCYDKNIKVAINPSNIKEVENLKPYILFLDKYDLERDISLEYTGEVLKMSEGLLKKGSGVVIVNSKRNTIISTKEKNYRAYLNKKKMEKDVLLEKFNTSFALAGLSVGIDRDYDFVTSIKLSVACGVYDNFAEDMELDMSSIKKLMNSIEVEEI